jgi:hypothetical protein
MKKLIAVILISCSTSSFKTEPTGPANAYFKIKPVGYANDGTVFCCTERMVNGSGAQVIMPTTYGFLLVSAKGKWEETTYVTYNDFDSIEKFEKEFYGDISLKNPPAYMRKIIETNKIAHKADSTGNDQYYWSNKGIFNSKGQCVSLNAQQQTITGIKSTGAEGKRIKAGFAIKNVLFFDNKMEEGYLSGANFDLEDNYGSTIDYWTITGICFLRPGNK